MPDRQLTICIPTYQNYQQLEWCLSSLVSNTSPNWNVVIINNCSSKDSMKDINSIIEKSAIEFKDLFHVIQPGSNLKWMGSINMGLHSIHALSSKYFCMMNDDVLFIPSNVDFWDTLLSAFDDEQVGAVGPCSNFVSGNQSLFQTQLPNTIETTCLIGMCMIVRTSLLKGLGGLDESLPGGDDLDSSIRIRDAHHKLIVNRYAYLHHIGQQTGQRVFDDWDSKFHQERTNNAIIKKHGIKKWLTCWSHKWQKYDLKVNINPIEEVDLKDAHGRAS